MFDVSDPRSLDGLSSLTRDLLRVLVRMPGSFFNTKGRGGKKGLSMILVGNKSDEENRVNDVEIEDFKRAFDIGEHVLVSAKTGTNVRECFKSLIDNIGS